ncbi:MAG: 23S rRNA (guanosine(2251)-2'-O)-methyltransferase RlmB [Deltaproteobacteria bacterium]|jgi:23S rRNA (guanosine2251-2'-O)-methyltransferase|nr:23S rRNA (guanosine(2251)-2'-O)-methyltransferase RlmB [Deltaproteobacteria bacterium]MCL5880816.1 23S rRNA (guanosine(2251)-2'-O)-methyltransferase RlmB [Deltaproteobacteria bacterium]MDA8304282.1 23S rRNA (guanosine(2251)-2'-O)-methyltransferase RlmB [Deltaproteobacteria bacterium]
MQLIIYGVNTIREAVFSGYLKRGGRVYASEKKWKNGIIDKSLIKLLKEKNIDILTKNDNIFLKDYGKEALMKGIAANVDYREKTYEELLENTDTGANLNAAGVSMPLPLYLILDEITDPQNLGSIIRTANCSGISGIIMPKSNSVFITSSVAYVSQGALFYVDAVRVTNISRIIEDLKKRGVWVVGLSNEAKDTIYDMDYNMPLAIVVGSEGKGLRRLTVENCDKILRIPMESGVNSLNASISFAVAAYEILRQRKYGGGKK